MAEFCKCGSLVINGKCTNKSCAVRKAEAAPQMKASARNSTKASAARGSGAQVKSLSGAKAPAKGSRTRRASKCITYNLYDTKSSELPENK